MASACQCWKARWLQRRSVTSRRYWLGSISSHSTSAAAFGSRPGRSAPLRAQRGDDLPRASVHVVAAGLPEFGQTGVAGGGFFQDGVQRRPAAGDAGGHLGKPL